MINNENRAASCCEQPDGPHEEMQGSPALLPPDCNATGGNDQGLDDPVDPDHLSIPADRQAILAERLSEGHLRMLQEESAIAEDVILARGYRTITSPKDLLDLGFAPAQRRVPGLLLPLHPTDGGKSPFCVYRPDQPREVATRDGQKKVLKYEVPKGSGTRLDCPPDCQPLLKDPAIPLWITEGQKKADALISQNLCAIALLGVWNWKGRNDLGGTTFAADWDYIALQGREVRIVFDSDVMTKASVQDALQRLTEHLQRKGAMIKVAYLPTEGGHKLGVDDWLAQGHTAGELEGLLEGPRPAPQAAKPQVEILEEPPAIMSRPLVLIDGKAYAATWLYVRKTLTEEVDKRTGQIIRLRKPKVVTRQELFVLQEDGTLFGPGGDQPLEELGLLIHLPEIPPPGKLWSKRGVMRYRAARNPAFPQMVSDPIDVFQRIVDVVESFVDFNRSLADQRTMAEMVGCYVLATWMLDAFHVIGFLWPNGDRGSGKTQLISLIAELSYLGQLILAGGSFAALRDLADYGALLAFDDAENLSDPKKTDPDKRALLLAGNRKGVTVPLKEPDGERRWKTRHVNAFCPRIFSAIHIPDMVLASRTIVVPLIRTADRDRGNSSPSDYSQWPHDRDSLIDDLWAVALGHLAQLPAHERKAKRAARLTGRDLEPWLAMLSIASWLDMQDSEGTLTRYILLPGTSGIEGEQDTSLFERLEALSVAYQGEREDLETSDTTGLLLQALCHCAIVPLGPCGPFKNDTGVFTVTTSEVTEAFEAVAEEEEADISWMGERSGRNRRIGKLLARLRFARAPRPGGIGSRRWRVELQDLYHRMMAYGLEFPAELLRHIPTNGPNGPHGTMAQDTGEMGSDQSTEVMEQARLPMAAVGPTGFEFPTRIPDDYQGQAIWREGNLEYTVQITGLVAGSGAFRIFQVVDHRGQVQQIPEGNLSLPEATDGTVEGNTEWF